MPPLVPPPISRFRAETNGTAVTANALVDTDVFIDHLRGARHLTSSRDRLHYSVITRCELFAGRATEEAAVRRLLGPFRELGISRSVAEKAGQLRRDLGLTMPDALIAATALEHRLVLRTRNLRDFARVADLQVHSPA